MGHGRGGDEGTEFNMCVLCGCDWSRVRCYLGLMRVVLCDHCHAESIRDAMNLAPLAIPAPCVETTTQYN